MWDTQAPTFTQSAATLAIPTQQATASVAFTQPATVSAVPAQPMEISPSQSQKSLRYCVICNTTRNQCLTKYPIPSSQIGEIQKKKKTLMNKTKKKKSKIGMAICKNEKNWKNKNLRTITIKPPTSSESTSTSDTKILTPQPSRTPVDRYSNPNSVTLEEGEEEDTFEDPLDEID